MLNKKSGFPLFYLYTSIITKFFNVIKNNTLTKIIVINKINKGKTFFNANLKYIGPIQSQHCTVINNKTEKYNIDIIIKNTTKIIVLKKPNSIEIDIIVTVCVYTKYIKNNIPIGIRNLLTLEINIIKQNINIVKTDIKKNPAKPEDPFKNFT